MTARLSEPDCQRSDVGCRKWDDEADKRPMLNVTGAERCQEGAAGGEKERGRGEIGEREGEREREGASDSWRGERQVNGRRKLVRSDVDIWPAERDRSGLGAGSAARLGPVRHHLSAQHPPPLHLRCRRGGGQGSPGLRAAGSRRSHCRPSARYAHFVASI